MTDNLRSLRMLGATGDIVTNEGTGLITVPVVALVEGVIYPVNADQPELVTAEELARDPMTWDGVPVLVNHPVDADGVRVSASAPGISASYQIGKVANPRIVDRKLLMDAVLDPARVASLGAKRLLERVRAGERLEVSVGAYVEAPTHAGSFRGQQYGAKWTNIRGDHLAILPDGMSGACSVKMGCGLNRAAQAHLVTACGDMYAMPTTEMAAPTGSDTWLRGKLDEKLRSTVPAYGGVVAVFTGEKRVVYRASLDGKSEQYEQRFTFGDSGEPELRGAPKGVYSIMTYSTAAQKTFAKAFRLAGDVPGHEFHGNQYSGGGGGGGGGEKVRRRERKRQAGR